MKTFTRCDLVHADYKSDIPMLLERAKQCRLIVKEIVDIHIDGENYTKLLFDGTRWGYCRYLLTAILHGEAEFKAIPGLFKLMFM